ncbi:tetratricopeptide repeat protein, partial [Archangium sp.]|uniref:tetratricopeptide repeat protein n=1 Tax=Archangium sp. TaxID=1872627 RepID=UPI002ED83A9B
LALANQLAEALAAAHNAGLVHRALSSSRVVLVPGGAGLRAMVTGFELGREPSAAELPHPAPEQRVGGPATPRSDLWALGAVLLELVTGERPSPAVLDEALVPRLAGMDPGWRETILCCLERAPQARFASAREVSRALSVASQPSVAIRTLLMTDLVESTRLVETLGDTRAAQLFNRHDRLARDLLRAHGGQEIDKTDGFLLLFDRPVDATRYALAYHQALAELGVELGVPLAARTGIHLGEVLLRENPPAAVARGAKPVEVEGLAKPVAARTMSLAIARQTLMTRAAFDMARRAFVGTSHSERPPEWMVHGPYLFAGVEEPTEICEVGVPGFAPLAPPPGDGRKVRRASATGSAVSRVRRRTLLTAAGALLLAGATGVVSWPGLRLAGGGRAPRGEGRSRRVVAVLGFKNLSGNPDVAWLSPALAEMLNAELAAAEDLRTISGENVIRLKQELALKDSDGFSRDTLARLHAHLGTDYVVLGSYLAVPGASGGQLRLVLRLQDTTTGDTLTTLTETEMMEDVLKLISRMGARLRGRLGAEDATSNSPDARASLPANAEALRYYAEGLSHLRSYDTLLAQERLTQAVEADPQYALAHSALAEAWSTLGYDTRALEEAQKALALAGTLNRADRLLVDGRLREFGKEWNKAIDIYDTLYKSYPDNLDYGLKLASAQLSGGHARDALGVLEELQKHPASASERGRLQLARAEVMDATSNYKGALEAAARAAKEGTEQGARLLMAQALSVKGHALLRLGKPPEEALAVCEEARRIFTAAGDRNAEAKTLKQMAIIAHGAGDYEEAKRLFGEAVHIWRELGYRLGVATGLHGFADCLLMQGDLAGAKALFEESVGITHELGNRRVEAGALVNLAVVHHRQGVFQKGKELALEGIRLSRETEYRYCMHAGLWVLGALYLETGDLGMAQKHFAESTASAQAIGDQRFIAYNLVSTGNVALLSDELVRARGLFEEAMRLRKQAGGRSELAEARMALGRLELEAGRTEEAERLLREAVETFKALKVRACEVEAALLLARVSLAQGRLADARARCEQTESLARTNQNALVRLAWAVTSARVASAGQDADAIVQLQAAVAEARQLGSTLAECEARLALAEVEKQAGHAKAAQEQFQTLEKYAAERKLLLFARLAQTHLRRGVLSRANQQ